MKNRMLLRLLPLLCAIAALVSGCNPSPSPTAGMPEKSDKPLMRVGVNPDYPPIIFKQDNNIAGLEADLARELARELNVNIQFVVMEWEQLIPALEENKIDIIMSGMSITRLRSVLVTFTNPYMDIGQLALVRTEDAPKFPFAKAIQLRNDRIGVKKGTTGEMFVTQTCPDATAVPFDNPQQAFRALVNNDIDIMIYDAPFIWSIAAENETKGVEILPFYLTKEQLAWAVNRRNSGLATTINKLLVRWEESGKLTELKKRWLPL